MITLLANVAGAASEIEQRILDHVNRAAVGGLQPDDFHHLVYEHGDVEYNLVHVHGHDFDYVFHFDRDHLDHLVHQHGHHRGVRVVLGGQH